MIHDILMFTHIAAGILCITYGVPLLRAILQSKPLERRACAFLYCQLSACITGLLFPFRELQTSHLLAMAAVYAAGVSIFLMKRSTQSRTAWVGYATSLVILLCICTLFLVQHLCNYLRYAGNTDALSSRKVLLMANSTIVFLFILAEFCVMRQHKWQPEKIRNGR